MTDRGHRSKSCVATRPATQRRRGQDGFTLIEITVALMAGLIVALGIVGLSKETTRTFHEEMRSSAAESNLRTAVDRLRADLARAAYMSTSNVATDPTIAKSPGTLNPIIPGMVGLHRLASIHLFQGGSVATNGIALSLVNAVNPDAIEIGGNVTSTDQFEVQIMQPTGGAGGCQRIVLSPTTPSMYRVIGASLLAGSVPQAAQELNNLFQPAPVAMQGIVRIVDDTAHTQYVATCPGKTPAGILGAGANLQPYVDIDPTTPILTAQQTQTVGSLTGFASGRAAVNPVQIVRWEIMPASAEPTQYVSSPLGTQPLKPTLQDPLKYDLIRSYVDARSGNPVPETRELIAEYAVDLSFAFSVETGLTNLAPNIVNLSFDAPANATWAQDVSTQPLPAVQDPARIRSVRARLVTRTAQGDRLLNVAVPNPAGAFMYRYCLLAACDPVNLPGVLQYARARTVTTEVSLHNQSRSFF
jgi:prepilin-type N-terminal cleavage/methylation domain-containing protein